MPVYPISFSIPSCKIVDTIPPKTRLLAHIIPGDTRTYIYDNESDYYQGYRESWFALTCKKAGWDCMRHYEIIANGCIPLFLDLHQCPPCTLTTLPKELILQSNLLYFQILDSGLTPEYEKQCINIINNLLRIARDKMTCIATAKYVLDTIKQTNCNNILYLSGNTDPDYLRCMTLIGFKQLLGSQCHDYPRIPHIYTDWTINKTLWGRGMTYSQNVNPELRDNEKDDTIIEDIIAHKYDVIVFGSGHRGVPFADIVQQYYKSDEIIVLCGEDCDQNLNYATHCCSFKSLDEHVFIREL